MPVHFLPVTRREFLARTVGAGAALVLGRRARAEQKADPNRFALFSDTHIAADPDARLRGVNMSDHLAKVVAQVAACPTRPAGAIVSGDLAVNAGMKGDYVQLGRLLAPLREAKFPVHLALGNHDNRENFLATLKDYAPAESLLPGRCVSIVESPRANWFLLDSLDRPHSVPGVLGAAQRKWLADALDARKDKPAIVVAHHDPYKPPARKDAKRPPKFSGLTDVDELFEVLAPRRHVKAYVFGHRHRWARGERDGIHLVDIPAAAYVFDRTQPSGWVLAEVRPDGLTLQLQSLDGRHKDHGRKIELAWRG